jgi:hypothetical protein
VSYCKVLELEGVVFGTQFADLELEYAYMLHGRLRGLFFNNNIHSDNGRCFICRSPKLKARAETTNPKRGVCSGVSKQNLPVAILEPRNAHKMI